MIVGTLSYISADILTAPTSPLLKLTKEIALAAEDFGFVDLMTV